MKHTHKCTQLTALLLALLLTGCAAPSGKSGSPSEAGAPSETVSTASEADMPLETSVSMSFDEPADSGAAIQDETDETPAALEDQELMARTGLAEAGFVEVTAEDAKEINRAVAGMQAAYVAGPNGEDPLVKARDWSAYSSALGTERLSRGELEFYNRLDKMCLKYLSTSGFDGVRNANNKNDHTRYKIGGVQFGDLGLSMRKAQDVLEWFAYNNPQYYFLNKWSAWASGIMYPCIYEFAVDGTKRAEITNELFDKLDGWVQTVADSASTTYQKEVLANNLICESVTYNHDALLDRYGEEMWICQSMYSAVMLENTVCTGYSETFCAMMSALGVDATAAVSDSHAWNVVRLEDGNWYAVDVCWNDTDRNPPYKNNYLNVGEEIVSATNSRNESHTYRKNYAAWIPAIAKERYKPTDEELPKLPTPQNFRATEVGTDSIRLAWDEVPGAADYQVLLYTDTSRSKVWYSRRPSSPTSLFEPPVPLKPDTTYAFGVRAKGPYRSKSVADSDWTYITVTTAADGAATEQIAAPANVRAVPSETTQGKAILSWDPVPGAAVYSVCAYTDATYTTIKEGVTITFPADKGSSINLNNVEAGNTYYLGVQAGKDVDGKTVWSNRVNLSYTHTAATAP